MSFDLRSTGPKELGEIVARVMEDFAYLLPSEGALAATAELPLCFSSVLPGGQDWLMLRGSAEVGQRLAESATGDAGDGLGEDAFKEFCNLVTSHLVQTRHTESGPWSAFVPQPGAPSGRLCTQVTLDVEGQPLEASLWSSR